MNHCLWSPNLISPRYGLRAREVVFGPAGDEHLCRTGFLQALSHLPPEKPGPSGEQYPLASNVIRHGAESSAWI